MLRSLFVGAVAVSFACSSASPAPPATPEPMTVVSMSALPSSDTLASLPTDSVFGSMRFERCVVTYSLSRAVLNLSGQPIRVLSYVEVPLPQSQRLPGSGVCLLPMGASGSNGYSGPDGSLLIQPRSGLTWGEVASEADLDIQVH